MDRPKLGVADVFRRYGAAYREQHGAMSIAQRRVMPAIEQCRTPALGGHLERCDQCGYERNALNSCRDRLRFSAALAEVPVPGSRALDRGPPLRTP